jgi:hypothetical protein
LRVLNRKKAGVSMDFGSADSHEGRIDLDVNMFSGTYHISVVLLRHDLHRPLDLWEPAATHATSMANGDSRRS